MNFAGNTFIFIDLDNTIIRNPFHTAVFPEISKHLGAESSLPPGQITELLLREHSNRLEVAGQSVMAYDWEDILQTVSRRLGIKSKLSITELVEEYARPPYISLISGAKRILQSIRKEGRAIYAATNGFMRYQRPVLKALGIWSYFDRVLTPDKSNALKDSLEFYGGFLHRAAINISVGDSYRFDIIGPKRMGMHAVWVTNEISDAMQKYDPFRKAQMYADREDHEFYPDAIIESLNELLGVIERIEHEQYQKGMAGGNG